MMILLSSETMLLKGKTFGGFSVYEDAVKSAKRSGRTNRLDL